MKRTYDVVIVGGGVTGSASACFLAAEPRFDGSVLVVERDPTYEHCPSARATGGFRQQFSTPENVQIGLFGVHFLKHLDEYLSVDGETPDVGFREQGYLLIATAEMLPRMCENHAMQRALGADIAFQSPSQLEARFPWISAAGIAGGFLGLSNEGWVDPYSLLQAYRRKARSLGVDFVADEAMSIEREGDRVSAVTLRGAGRVGAGTVVNAAGARDVAGLAAQVDVALPIEARKRCTFVFECREDVAGVPLTILPNGVGFRPEGRTFLCNVAPPAARDPVTHDIEVDHDLFEEYIWPALAERVPAFEAIKVLRAYACHYDLNTLDGNAIIGRPPGLANFLVATGFSGHGLQQSPAVGRAVSELVTYGEFRTLDLTRFGYERVLTGEGVPETNCY